MAKQFNWKLIAFIVTMFVFFYLNYGHIASVEMQNNRKLEHNSNDVINANNNIFNNHQLPLTRFELGRRCWSFLHTMATNFPLRDGETEQSQLTVIHEFLKLWGIVLMKVYSFLFTQVFRSYLPV